MSGSIHQVIGLPHLRILKILVQEVRHDDARWDQRDFFAIKRFVEDSVDELEAMKIGELPDVPTVVSDKIAQYDEILKAVMAMPPEVVRKITIDLEAHLKVGEEVKKAPESGAAGNETAGIQETGEPKVEEPSLSPIIGHGVSGQ
jgi:hypothetical protein